MNAQENVTYFYTDCQGEISEDNILEHSGIYKVRTTIESNRGELDQTIELADVVGQHIKIDIATVSLEKVSVYFHPQICVDYLTRKSQMIVDYESRHVQGDWIASTRVERWNGIAISNRCKHLGTSWTESGVLAIGLHAAEAKRNSTQTAQINTPQHTSL